MEKHVVDLLEAAGIAAAAAADTKTQEEDSTTTTRVLDKNKKNSSSEAAIKHQMDAWLGIKTKNSNNEDDDDRTASIMMIDVDDEMLTAEDVAPLPMECFRHFCSLLQAAWQPSAASTSVVQEKDETSAAAAAASSCSIIPHPPGTATTTGSRTSTRDHQEPSTAASADTAFLQWLRYQNRNLLLERHDATAVDNSEALLVTLAETYDSVRATLWLRTFLELHLANDNNDASSNGGIDDNMMMSDETTVVEPAIVNARLLLLGQQEEPPLMSSSPPTLAADVMEEDDNDQIRVQQQQKQQQQQRKHEFALIRSLYHHMQQLPILQSHIHQYTKSLQQPNNNNRRQPPPVITASGLIVGSSNSNSNIKNSPIQPKNANSPPTHEDEVLNGSSTSSGSSGNHSSSFSKNRSIALGTTERLAQYQYAQNVSIRLQREWDEHLQRLQDVCVVFYRCSSVAGRQFTRTCLARTWADYLASSSSSSSGAGAGSSSTSLRLENTQAAGIGVTLNVLERIVMGISSSCKNHAGLLLPSYQHLLLQQLIPLHQPNTLVLWRDQTPVLQLYHEPLTKCIGILLQKDEQKNSNSKQHRRFHLFAATIQALLQPDVFPIAGNSSKQVLLLHEIDTLLSLVVKTNNDQTKKLGDKATENVGDQNDDVDETIQALIHIRPSNDKKNSTSSSSSSSSSSSWWTDLLHVLARCMSCENSLISERALQFCKNASFLLLIRHDADQACDVLLPALVRRSSNAVASGPGGAGSGVGGAGGYYNDDVSWNPTVRKMTYLTLKRLRETIHADTFERACNRVFGSGDSGTDHHHHSTATTIATVEHAAAAAAALPSSSSATVGDNFATGIARSSTTTTTMMVDTSLKAGMGSWRPPTSKATAAGVSSVDGDNSVSGAGSISILSRQGPRLPGSNMMPPPSFRPPHRGRGKVVSPGRGVAPWATSSSSAGGGGGGSQPPLTITGVAPWAMSQRQSPPPIPLRPPTEQSRPQAGQAQLASTSGASAQQPPLTITGVAPWAMQPPPVAHKRRAQEAQLGGITEDPQEKKDVDTTCDNMDVGMREPSGYERLLAYMKKLKPEDEEEGISSWSQMQMAETPTLLPNLKFHDLVFGHDLGAGAFGSVRYARLIDRSKTRSHWSEYAVKIISTEKIRTLGYEASVQREIAVLRILSHPGIARLISSFRFREGAYLVLEYASGGDLHALLRKHGSLDQDSTRFVIGECCAALASIHEAGLLYGDLKPENILLTESGHLKLTDFGGCRPVTQKTKELIQSIAQNALKDLRDGDWKAKTVQESTAESMVDGGVMVELNEQGNGNDEIEDGEDIRVEGTTAYLPPEVVLGAYPTTAADSWALGCVMFQCLSGRPPLLEADDAATRHRIVSFHVQDSSKEVNGLFQGKHAAGISAEARSLIENLLERDAACRPAMAQVAQHNFFLAVDSSSGATPMDVFSLHKQPAYPLDVGDVSPTPDSDQWSRRQYSSIWAPQPAAYDMALQDLNINSDRKWAALGAAVSAPIAEGDEASAFFTATALTTSMQKPGLRKIMGLGRIAERAPLPPMPENASNSNDD